MFLLVKTYNPKRKTIKQNRPFETIEAEKKAKGKPVSVGKMKLSVRKIFLYPVIAVAVLGLLAMVNNYQENLAVAGIEVNFAEGAEHPFLNAQAVTGLIDTIGGQTLVGKKMSEVGLRELEDHLSTNPFIKNAEVYKSVGGMLNVEVSLRKPLARIINNSGHYVYIDEEGKKFPNSSLHASRVILVRGDFEETVADTFVCETVEAAVPLFQYIQHDDFWNAQISEVVINSAGEVTLYPQVGDMKIEFGQPVEIEKRFRKAREFYEQVVPEKGWSAYRTINVSYAGQVIAR